MKEMQFTIEIHAPKERVWDTLWQDETFRQWASIIDPGTYMKGVLKKGNEVQFISAENGYGVTSVVEKLIENEFVLLTHSADTTDAGAGMRKNEWTGGKESYLLAGKGGVTVLTVVSDIPLELEEYFENVYPKVLERIKDIAEE